jgi:hypothetical protein
MVNQSKQSNFALYVIKTFYTCPFCFQTIYLVDDKNFKQKHKIPYSALKGLFFSKRREGNMARDYRKTKVC